MDYLKKYWTIFVFIATLIFNCAIYQQKASNLESRVTAIEAMNVQTQLSQIQTDLQWIKMALKGNEK